MADALGKKPQKTEDGNDLITLCILCLGRSGSTLTGSVWQMSMLKRPRPPHWKYPTGYPSVVPERGLGCKSGIHWYIVGKWSHGSQWNLPEWKRSDGRVKNKCIKWRTGKGRTETVYEMLWKHTASKDRGEQSKGEMLQRSKSFIVSLANAS